MCLCLRVADVKRDTESVAQTKTVGFFCFSQSLPLCRGFSPAAAAPPDSICESVNVWSQFSLERRHLNHIVLPQQVLIFVSACVLCCASAGSSSATVTVCVSFSVFPSLSSLHVLLSSTACVASGLFTLCFYYLGKLSQDTLGLNDPHLDNWDALKSQNWLPTTVKTLHFIQEDWQTDGQGLQEVHEYFISPIYSSMMMEVLLTFCNHMSMVKVYWGGKIAKISQNSS